MIIDYALRKATKDHEDRGFTLLKRKNRNCPSERTTDTDFADDIATLSDTLQNVALLLRNKEIAGKEVGLLINE